MSEILRIASLCDALKEEHGTGNPFRLADAMGVKVVSCPDFQKLEGMYKVILGKPFVFLKGDLSRRRAGEVLAHELGHHVLHREMGEDSIVQEHFLVDMTLKPEYEANLFAAQLLVPEEEFCNLLREGLSPEESAMRLKLDPKMGEWKMRILQERKKHGATGEFSEKS